MSKWFWYTSTSLVAHAALVTALQATPRSEEVVVETKTEFFPVELPPPPPPPTPKARPPEPEAPKQVQKQALPAPKPAQPVPNQTPEATQAAAPVRLAGLGLSNAGFVFAAAEASNVASEATPPRPAAPAAPPLAKPVEGPPLVRVSDLSERPTPPALDGTLRQNYPRDLERQGIEGDALLRLTLSVTGKVVEAKAVSQSNAAFAEACRKTLLGTAWSPPRDRSGRPVRTTLDYRCRFRVSR